MTKIDVDIHKSSPAGKRRAGAPELVRSDDHRVKRTVSATWLVAPGFSYKTAMSAEPTSERCGGHYFISCRSRGRAMATGRQSQLAVGDVGDGHAHWRKETTCGRVECRTCGDREVRREVSTIMRRFRALARQLRYQGFDVPGDINDGKYWDHSTFSPPASQHHRFLTVAGYRAMRHRAERYAWRVGYRAFYIVFHLVHEGEGTARQRRERLEAWQRGELELELWPHFHVYGLRPTWGDLATADLYAKTGWVFRSFYNSRCRYRNVYKTLLYELGHASAPVVDGRSGQIASPVGWLHPHYLGCKVEKERQPVTCPLCGDECIHADSDGEPVIGHDGQPIVAHKCKEKRTFFIRDDRADRIEARGGLARTGCKRHGSLAWLSPSEYSRWNLPPAGDVPA